MRNMILICGLTAGCGLGELGYTVSTGPGDASVSMPSRWVQGRLTEVSLELPNFENCDYDGLFCHIPAGITTTVLSVTCHGCTIVEDPTGTTRDSQTPISLMAVAITDGQISVESQMRFDATQDKRWASSSAQGDHEIGLDVQCRTIDVAELHLGGPPAPVTGLGLIDGALLHPCGATRLANEVVVAFPRVHTFRDYMDFPFCLPGMYCESFWSELRPREQLSIRPAPVGWWQVLNPSTDDPVFFAELPADVSGSVEFHTQLLGGVDATASLEVPALADPP